MTEIPEHLLERSKARRAALGLLKDGETASSAAPVKAAGAAPAAAAASAAPAKAAAAPAPVKKVEPPAPYVLAALSRKKAPFWASFCLLFMPIWAILYVGTLERPPQREAGVLGAGSSIYAAKCASCHGGNGQGGVGSALNNGSVVATFPNAADHLWWVINGSGAVSKGDNYGSPDRPGGQRVSAGGMPAWAAGLSAKEIVEVVYYERIRHGLLTEEEELALHDLAESPDLPAKFAAGTTVAELQALLDALAAGAEGEAAAK